MLSFVIVALLLAVLAVILALQNTAPAALTFLAWSFHGPLAIMLLIALATGVAITFFGLLPALVRGRWTIRSQKKKLGELESIISDHRAKLDEAQKKLQQQETNLPGATPPQPAA